jgi:tripartite-type tricarboxylate transporter receptor subunit TctC
MCNKHFCVVVVICVLCLFVETAQSQSKYPERPIQGFVGYAAGGATDSAARILAEYMGKQLGQPVLIVNKPGGGSAIAGNELFRAKPDGYTIGMFTDAPSAPEYALNPERFIYKRKDLLGVAQWSGLVPTIFTRYDASWKTLEDLVKHARANPNKLKWSHSGKGGRIWMTGMIFMEKAGIKMLDVPFQGDAESITALLGNHVDVAVMTYGSMAFSQMEAKKIKPLAVSTVKRFELLPDVPSTQEFGYELGFPEASLGTYVPRATPEEAVEKLHDAILKATREPELKAKWAKMGLPVWYKGTKDFEKLIDDWGQFQYKTLKQLGLF